MTEQPTQGQIREFWEAYGARCLKCGGLITNAVIPDRCNCYSFELDIDLNNLFKYAVPKLQDKGNNVELYAWEHKGFMATVYKDSFSQRGSDGYEPFLEPISQVKEEDPALALFWALRKVKEANGKA